MLAPERWPSTTAIRIPRWAIGAENTAVGNAALFHNSTGSFNTALGFDAGDDVTTATHVICIGASVTGANVSNSCYIGHIWNQPGGSQAVYVNSEGKLGLMVSSRRFKDEIRRLEKGSEVIYGLRPVSFRYKPEIEPTRPLSFGLIAEHVEKISPDLVTRDSEGKPLSVRYDAVNAMLLNEFLKEHRRVEGQQAKMDHQDMRISQLKSTITQQQKRFELKLAQQEQQIAALRADLQRFAADIELNKAQSQTVVEK